MHGTFLPWHGTSLHVCVLKFIIFHDLRFVLPGFILFRGVLGIPLHINLEKPDDFLQQGSPTRIEHCSHYGTLFLID
jgi:hypothetical protein